MKKLIALLLLVGITALSFAQKIEQNLKSFTKIVASPRINVILKKGNHESIQITYTNIDPAKINFHVYGETLSIYLNGAKKIEPTIRKYDGEGEPRKGIYDGVSITAYVTYVKIEALEIRGNQELTCYDPIDTERFTLRAYGENEINIASLKAENFIASLYGQNSLKIKEGTVTEQKYRLYGENSIDTKAVLSQYTSTSIFGEGKIRINTSEEIRVNSFGEPKILVAGGGQIFKRLVFGKADIQRRD